MINFDGDVYAIKNILLTIDWLTQEKLEKCCMGRIYIYVIYLII